MLALCGCMCVCVDVCVFVCNVGAGFRRTSFYGVFSSSLMNLRKSRVAHVPGREKVRDSRRLYRRRGRRRRTRALSV